MAFTTGAVITSFVFIALGFSANSDNSHDNHGERAGTGSLQYSDLEHQGAIIRAGDAKINSDFSINPDFVDPDDNCDFCTQINYSSSTVGRAAIVYQISDVDLSNSRRLVFFAKGQKGGEQVTFFGAGKTLPENKSNEKTTNKLDLFPDSSFEFKSQLVTLSNHWKKYTVDLRNLDLKRISYPFGVVILSDPYSESKIFYFKGVTFDSKKPSVPLLITLS